MNGQVEPKDGDRGCGHCKTEKSGYEGHDETQSHSEKIGESTGDLTVMPRVDSDGHGGWIG